MHSAQIREIPDITIRHLVQVVWRRLPHSVCEQLGMVLFRTKSPIFDDIRALGYADYEDGTHVVYLDPKVVWARGSRIWTLAHELGHCYHGARQLHDQAEQAGLPERDQRLIWQASEFQADAA